MTVYQGFFDLKPGTADLEFAGAVEGYLGHLKEQGLLKDWRLLRRKLGLGPRELGEFQLIMEFDGLEQLDQAFTSVSTRVDPIEGLHHAVNSKIARVSFALYRDFPDPQRRTGEERF
ncbi:hypothetical protein SAMN06265365_101207 [Tistlia consotensis]|uniref:Uncharacterized protein n=1 Tax=Tistlia consotensis USBA 355 TaxID=560819 RepID=A0A1Y6B866_9PROT|nr:DUF6614 family protein [Tistlia consotensis]SME89375.1 hypothetical protein SAMN05428998_101205 [Tistlia consotensis USBA 355]SNR25920.1 hypothetical protein SAMN06265365_101207 [Tistlia consotensis]